ncbi:MAG TPA: hypothetical protein VFF53_08605, partial [Geobacteraceae bacterium]|nr:hypothetical protein [Geobacteraceae bacterium]
PELLTAPRFWAEEGTNFFAYAYAHSWWENLLHPQFGYYTLYNAIATSLAAAAPLEYAPAVTTVLAGAVQVGVAAAVIWWRLPQLPALWQRVVIAFGIQFLAHPRIWLTTIGVQYFLCVLSFLILLEEGQSERRPPLSRQFLLAFNGLTGVLSCFLIPAFLLKWHRERSRNHLRYALILAACLLLQTGVFAAALGSNDGGVDSRLRATAPLRLVARFIHFQFVVPFTGRVIWLNGAVRTVDDQITALLRPIIGNTPETCDYMVLQQLTGLVIIALLAVAAFAVRRRRDTGVVLTAFIVVATFSTLFSVNSSGGPRYTYAPSVMILVFTAVIARTADISVLLRRTAVGMLIAATLLCDYRPTMVFAYSPDWPKWRQELAQWRANPAYQMRLWPAPFVMTLPPSQTTSRAL